MTDGKPLVICASAACVWQDLASIILKTDGARFDAWEQPFDLMAVNDMGMHLPYKLAHWYSNDGWLKYWSQARRPWFHNQVGPRGARDEQIRYHCWSNIPNFPFKLEVHELQGGGTSSLNACLLGKKLGYKQIYLCGAPMDNKPHYFDPPWGKENFDNSHERGIWESMKPQLSGVVSMSGVTKEILNV